MRADDVKVNLRESNRNIAAAFFFYCLMTIVILLVRDVMGISISKWLILVVCIFPYIIFDLSYAMAFTIFLLPLAGGLPFNYICICSLIIILAKNINQISLSNYILVPFLIIIVELMSVFYGRFSLADFIRFVGPFMLMSLLIFKNIDDDMNYETMVAFFLLGVIGGELSVILQTINAYDTNILLSIGTRLGETSMVYSFQDMRLSYNPNSLGRICAFGISAVLVLVHKSKMPKTILMIVLVSQILIGGLTLSRYFVVLLAVIAFAYLISIAESVQEFVKGVLVLGLVGIGVYFSVSYFAPNVVEGYLSRGLTQKEISNGRIEIANAYFDSVAQNPERLFLGVGLQKYMEKVGMYNTCHSGPQEILITWGVIGIFLVTLYIWGLYKHGWRGVPPPDRKIIYLLPLLVFLVGIQSGQLFSTNGELWLILPYAAMRLAQYGSAPGFLAPDSVSNII